MTYLMKPTNNGLASIDEVKAWMEAQSCEMIEEKIAKKKPEEATTRQSGRVISKEGNHYLLHDITVNGKTNDYLWSGTLLPGDRIQTSATQTQDEWLDNQEYRTIDGIQFDIPDATEYARAILALYRNRNIADGKEKNLLKRFSAILKRDFRSRMTTSTHIDYLATEDDIVKHHHKRSGEGYMMYVNIAGKDHHLDTTSSLETNIFFDIDNAQEIIDAIAWLTGKSKIQLLCHVKENKDIERNLVLGSIGEDYRFFVDADNSAISDWPARGVLVRERSDQP